MNVPPTDESQAIEARQAELACRALPATVWGVAAALTAVVYLIGAQVPQPWPVAWAGVLLALHAGRALYARSVLAGRGPDGDLDAAKLVQRGRRMIVLTTVIGAVAGGGTFAFFPRLGGESQALVTAICIGWMGGAVGALGAWPRHGFPWLAAFGGSLCLAWALFGGVNGPLVAALVGILVVYLGSALRDLGARTAAAIRAGLENERMRGERAILLQQVETLRREADAAALARARAAAGAGSAEPAVAAAGRGLAPPRAPRVVFVEDDPQLQDALAQWAAATGAQPIFASDGDEALAIAEDPATRPDVIVSDYRLPGTMNGLETVTCLQLQWAGVPAILLIEDADLGAAQEARKHGIVFLLRSGMAVEELTSEILRLAQDAPRDAR